MTESLFISKKFQNQIHSIGDMGKFEIDYNTPSKGSVPTAKNRGQILNKMSIKGKLSMEIDPEMTEMK